MFGLRFTNKPLRYLISTVLSYCLILLLCLPFSGTAFGKLIANSSLETVPQAQVARRENELLVRFRAGVSRNEQDTVLASHGARRKQQLRG